MHLCLLSSQVGPSLFEVRSSAGDMTYLVDPSLGACSCAQNRKVGSFKHLSAVHRTHPEADLGQQTPSAMDEEARKELFFVATGMSE